jgi:hypothetical protein
MQQNLALYFHLYLRNKLHLMNLFSTFLFLFLLGPIVAQEQPIEVPTIAIKIPLGKTVNTGTANVTFEEVVEDSRCPEGVQCVWAGNAKVQLQISSKDGATKQMQVLFENGKQPILYEDESCVIRALQLKPYPTADDGGVREYVLLISEEERS